MKACHPDLSGDNPETTNFCMFINEVYEVGFRKCSELEAVKMFWSFLLLFVFVISLELKHFSAGSQ